jgi:hypothetical protein
MSLLGAVAGAALTGQTPSLSTIPGVGPLVAKFEDLKGKFDDFKTQIKAVSDVLNSVQGIVTAAQVKIATDVKKMVDEGILKAVKDSTAAAEATAAALLISPTVILTLDDAIDPPPN